MCDYPFFIPQVVLFANSSLFWFKVTNEHREFRNYLIYNYSVCLPPVDKRQHTTEGIYDCSVCKIIAHFLFSVPVQFSSSLCPRHSYLYDSVLKDIVHGKNQRDAWFFSIHCPLQLVHKQLIIHDYHTNVHGYHPPAVSAIAFILCLIL